MAQKKGPKILYTLAEEVAVVFQQNAQGTFRWNLVAHGERFNLSPTDALTLLTANVEPVVE